MRLQVKIFSFITTAVIFTNCCYACIHDEIAANIVPQYIDTPRPKHFGRLLDEPYKNIRIAADFSGISQTAPAAAVDLITNRLVPAAINYFQLALQIVPFPAKLAFGSATLCYQATIPKQLKYIGVNADLAIFVTTSSGSATMMAWAVACFFERDTKRPIAGQLNINTDMLNLNDTEFANQLNIVLHEITHILGFSSALYDTYIDPATMLPLGQANVVVPTIARGAPTTMIILPQVVSYAQQYFDCPSLTGLELENQGSSASQGSHWERRVLGDEYMTSSYKKAAKKSVLTFALLEGTGWYQLNYSMTEPLLWGKNEGCGFINNFCINKIQKTANFQEFCNNLGQVTCTLDYRFKGQCAIQTTPGSVQYLAWDYFSNGTLSLDPFSDNCLYPVYFSDGDCKYDGIQYPEYDQVFGVDSRCFKGTLIKSSLSASTTPNSFCLNYKCVSNAGNWSLSINVSNVTLICQTLGDTLSVPGYSGYLVCPDPVAFCTIYDQPYCESACNGRGVCLQNQTCQCQTGWDANYDCSMPLNASNCTQCNGTSCYGDTCTSQTARSLGSILFLLFTVLCVISSF